MMSYCQTCQQIRFLEILFSLRWYVELVMFKIFYGVFGGRTRLAMPKTNLRAGLIVIEAWFRGY